MNDYLIIGADCDDNYLMHYGRRGMKWGQNIFGKKLIGGGKKNKKSVQNEKPVSVEEARRIASTTRNPNDVLKYAHMFNANELNEYTRRIQSMNQLASMKPKSRGKKILEGVAATTAAVGTVTAAAKLLGIDTSKATNAVGDFVKGKYSDVYEAVKRGDYDLNKSAQARKQKETNRKAAMSTLDPDVLNKFKDLLSDDELAKRIDIINKYKQIMKNK